MVTVLCLQISNFDILDNVLSEAGILVIVFIFAWKRILQYLLLFILVNSSY